ncbi:hypothetical protein QP019_07180 [Gallibacterium anatis]|nr:hypothetical protein [Gallibacterium anatis]WIM81175.1 hypothetical protein QP019_07180 [Gallibacterium anatis]
MQKSFRNWKKNLFTLLLTLPLVSVATFSNATTQTTQATQQTVAAALP